MVTVQEKVTCYHCGDVCEDETLHFDNKVFCCFGCKAVYELIEASDLNNYYENAELKAQKVQDRLASERKFNFLDLPVVSDKLLRYHDENMSLVRFYISGIHCSSCIYLLEHLPKLNGHILKSEVNFVRKEVSVTFDHEITLKEIAVLLASLGYPPTINLDSLDKSKDKIISNSIGMKIAVAGFCFGNSMLISLPEYLDVGFQLDASFKELFGWINLLLAFPVVFYAAQDYFISSYKGLKHKYLNIDVPISLGIITLFSRSIFEILTHAGPGYVDSLNGLIFFLLVGKWYQGKTYQALSFDRDYTSYFPISVSKITAGVEESVMIKDLKAGDEILLHNHELIPADGIVVAGEAKLDYSFVTGEAEPVLKLINEKVFAGGRQVGSNVTIRLEKEVNNSELTQLWNNQTHSKVADTKYDSLIDQVSKYFTMLIILLSVLTGTYWWFNNPAIVWDAVTAVLIVACPCALALAMPFGLGHGMRILGNKGLYLKNAQVIERFGKIRNLIFDKTGTLTKNDPMSIRFVGEELSTSQKQMIKTACANSAHPLSKLIANHFGDRIQKLPISDFAEEIGKGIIADIEGVKVKIGSAKFLEVELSDQRHESHVHISLGDRYFGYYRIKASYRDGIFEKLEQLRTNYRLHLLSGDNAAEEQHLETYFDQLAFNQKPQDKLNYVEQKTANALMIGDGLNDAGALKSADVGIAVCEDIHQFSPACDALLQADAVKDLPKILRFSKAVIRIVIIALLISFAYNIFGLAFAVTGNLTPVISAILMPISSVTVVGFITLAVNILGEKSFKD